MEKVKEDYGPFLFTPLNFGSMERKSGLTKDNKLSKILNIFISLKLGSYFIINVVYILSTGYLWVAEEECEVKVELTNPLPFELEVSNMVRHITINYLIYNSY